MERGLGRKKTWVVKRIIKRKQRLIILLRKIIPHLIGPELGLSIFFLNWEFEEEVGGNSQT